MLAIGTDDPGTPIDALLGILEKFSGRLSRGLVSGMASGFDKSTSVLTFERLRALLLRPVAGGMVGTLDIDGPFSLPWTSTLCRADRRARGPSYELYFTGTSV